MNEIVDDKLCTFAIRPTLRCFERVGTDQPSPCGQPAAWHRPGRLWFESGFYCAEHRQPDDVPAAGLLPVRRVHVTLDVYLAATSCQAPQAQAEAVARLEAAVKAVGGCLEVSRVISTFGKYQAQPAPGARPGDVGIVE